MSGRSAWIALATLGAFHGINPAMGWLFAVARGLQEGRRREVVRSLVPIALAGLAYLAAARLLGVAELDEVVKALTRRRRGARPAARS